MERSVSFVSSFVIEFSEISMPRSSRRFIGELVREESTECSDSNSIDASEEDEEEARERFKYFVPRISPIAILLIYL